ncbi:MAG: M56 family metallopeptidase, partial [Verrucomicrobiales bacterium]
SGDEVSFPGLGAARIAYSEELHSPAVWGWRKPIVLLPQGLDRHLSSEQLDWVIAHECAHLKRGDVVAGFLTRLLRAAFFFNPAIWLALRMMDKFAEQDCDRMATEALGMAPRESAESFLAVAAWTSGDRSLAPGLSASGRSAKQRLVDLMQVASRRPLTVGGFVVLLIAMLLIVPSFRPRVAEGAAVGALQARVAQLEEELRGKSVSDQRRERNVARSRERVAADVARIGAAAVHEAELLYQAAKKMVAPDEVEAAMAPLFERFPASNRAGCGALFLARMKGGGAREDLLLQCADEWGDCYFLDGTSVGGMARLYLSHDHAGTPAGRARLGELQAEFADAIDFSGTSLVEVTSK